MVPVSCNLFFYFQVEVKLTLQNGDPVPQTHNTAPIDNIGHSLFSEVTTKVGQSLLNANNLYYGFKAMYTNISSFSNPVKSGVLQVTG